ncbi:MAG: hypothetical protein JNL80_00675 [Phycisphaerae bacterium]|jgi:hypothetical protein|nr:hypothetical protein [Phycisphaerae bacterium]
MAWSVYGGSSGGSMGTPNLGRNVPGLAGPIGASVDTTAALDRILNSAQSGAPGAQREYWRAVMDRPNWCFLCNADPVKAEIEKPEADRQQVAPQPLLWRINDKTMVGVFTSESAAMETHRQIHNATPETKDSDLPPAAILTMPVPDAIRWLLSIPADRVSDIVVNRRSNVNVAYQPIQSLPALYEWVLDRLPDGLWDGYIKSVQDANHSQAWARLGRRFSAIRTWWLPADPGGANMPLVAVDADKKYLVVATHSDAAVRAFQRVVGEAAKDARPRVGPVQRDKLAELIDALLVEPEGPRHAVVNPGGHPATIELVELVRLLRVPVPA